MKTMFAALALAIALPAAVHAQGAPAPAPAPAPKMECCCEKMGKKMECCDEPGRKGGQDEHSGHDMSHPQPNP